MYNTDRDAAYFNQISKGHLPAHLGIEITEVAEGKMVGKMEIQSHLFAPNGFLHAGSLVSMADTIAGYATIAHLPEGGKSFTTLELKTSFLRAAREGAVIGQATPEHLGRTTQVWRVEIYSEVTQKKVAIFQCTQLILY